jgi:hypothetical protein
MRALESLRRERPEKIAERTNQFVFDNQGEETLSSGIQGKFGELMENAQNEIRLIPYISPH